MTTQQHASERLVEIDAIADAAVSAAYLVRHTPVVRSNNLSRLCGVELLLKMEHLQRTGSFKIRGAYNHMRLLDPDVTEVVAASAGNHAQGVALAARLSGKRATVFMPANAALPKVQATRDYGADVRLTGTVVEECMAASRDYAERTGAAYIPPFDDPDIIAGQGTLGLELVDQAPDAATVLVPVGGGGLISGVAAALAAQPERPRVIGVTVDPQATIADGLAVKGRSALTQRHIDTYVDDLVTVDDEAIGRALILLLERSKAVVEPSGAVGLAALLDGLVQVDGPCVVVLSGGNVDPLVLTHLVEHGLTAAGRYLTMRLVVPDRPGSLASVTRIIGEAGLSILSVEHHRVGVSVPMGEVEVGLTLETRDHEQAAAVIGELEAAGFRIALPRGTAHGAERAGRPLDGPPP